MDFIFHHLIQKKFIKLKKIKKFIIIGSAHNLKEIRIKEMQGTNNFFSPLFKKRVQMNLLDCTDITCFQILQKLPNIGLGGIK